MTGAGLAARLDAIAALAGLKGGPPLNEPTPNQRFRLARLLAILDRLGAVSQRQIAEEIVFPAMKPMRAAVWKGSSERRQVQRLVAEARRLRRSGYLELLQGRTKLSGALRKKAALGP
nr:DUF2285 domain-containing protein [Qipengyuania qiaonensis]